MAPGDRSKLIMHVVLLFTLGVLSVSAGFGPPPSPKSGGSERLYADGVAGIRRGELDQARAAFVQLLKRYPETKNAERAILVSLPLIQADIRANSDLFLAWAGAGAIPESNLWRRLGLISGMVLLEYVRDGIETGAVGDTRTFLEQYAPESTYRLDLPPGPEVHDTTLTRVHADLARIASGDRASPTQGKRLQETLRLHYCRDYLENLRSLESEAVPPRCALLLELARSLFAAGTLADKWGPQAEDRETLFDAGAICARLVLDLSRADPDVRVEAENVLDQIRSLREDRGRMGP